MNPQNERQRGKNTERAVAEILDGKRVGVLFGEDMQHDLFSVECKSRKSFVADSWFKQCEKNNKDMKIPLLIVHITGKHHANDYVIIRLKDFKQLIKDNNYGHIMGTDLYKSA